VRSDVWALGVILYEAIAGEVPFGGESVMEVAARVMQVAPKDLATLRPDSPPGLAPIIMTCLEKRPEARYPDIKALARALAPFSPRSALSVERISKLLGERSDVSGVAASVAGQAAGGAPPAGASSGTVPLAPPIRNQGGTIRGHSVSVGPHPRARWIAGGRWAAALAAVMGLGVLVALSFSRRASAPREVAASLSMQPPVPTGSRANGDPSAGMDPDPPAPSAAPSTTAPPSATAAAVPPPAAAVVKHASASAAHAAPPPSPDPTESASPKRNPLHVEAK
jgi:serine/threonine-protein kinase